MAQAKLHTKDDDGKKVPLACPQCGEQREGAILDEAARRHILLSCAWCFYKDDRGQEHIEDSL